MEIKNKIKSEIVKFGKMIYDRNLNAAYGGNISVRDGDAIYITPSGFNKAFLTTDDILITYINGNLIEKPLKNLKPSSESRMHFEIYKVRKDVNAIIHAHPPYCVALAIAHIPLADLLPETTIVLGRVNFVPYILPGGFELAEAVASSLKDSDACIMGNHGATVVGRDLFEAFNKLELLEYTAKSFILASTVKGANSLPEKDVNIYLEMHKNLFK